MGKNLPAGQETQVWSLGREDPLEKEMATHSSILAWKIPWTEEPGRLWSMVSKRVRHDWATSLSLTSISSVIHWLFSSVLSSCQFFFFFFNNFFLQFTSNLKVLWLETMLEMISHFLNLPCLDFSPKMWSMLQNVPCALRKKVYSAFRWNVLYVSIKFIWSSVSFKTCVSLLTFCSWWSIHWYKWSAKVPHYYYVTVNFPFYGC